MAILVPAAPVMVELAIRKSTEERIYDRSYRIRNNEVITRLKESLQMDIRVNCFYFNDQHDSWKKTTVQLTNITQQYFVISF